nr:MAG TPA: hypothetical protein [Caudoviricetes sp.]
MTPVPICYVCYLLTIVFKNRQRRSISSSVARCISRAISCSSHALSFIPLLLLPSYRLIRMRQYQNYKTFVL